MLKKTIIDLSIIAVIIGSVFIANGIILAWTSPSASPPDGNVAAPLNVGSDSQYKSGALGIGGVFRGYSNAIFDGNLGIGTADISNGLKLDVEGKVGATYYCDEDGNNCVESGDLGGECPNHFNDTGYNYCIQRNENSARNWYRASDYCADRYNARLCASSEWYNACINNKATNMTGNWEWVDSWSDGGGDSAVVRGLSGCSSPDRRAAVREQDASLDSYSFRCCRNK